MICRDLPMRERQGQTRKLLMLTIACGKPKSRFHDCGSEPPGETGSSAKTGLARSNLSSFRPSRFRLRGCYNKQRPISLSGRSGYDTTSGHPAMKVLSERPKPATNAAAKAIPKTAKAGPPLSGQTLTPWLVVVLVVVLFSGGLFGYDQGGSRVLCTASRRRFRSARCSSKW